MKDRTKHSKADKEARNRDPITGAPGSHPVGTAAGAIPGGLAGAAAGMAVGGPVGSVIGAAAGAVAGGLSGKGIAEVIDPTEEESYWKDSYLHEPYYVKGKPYEYYASAYRTGWEGRTRYEDLTFEDAETDLQASYNQSRGNTDPDWDEIKPAAHAAWNRVDDNQHSNPGEGLRRAFNTSTSPGDPGQLKNVRGK